MLVDGEGIAIDRGLFTRPFSQSSPQRELSAPAPFTTSSTFFRVLCGEYSVSDNKQKTKKYNKPQINADERRFG
uniref:Uncharacterized protein n=1 Tax=Candidatus Methanogaster sp. ANME-2c ERB4 TaxID=2759911 RepID=A0A7G9Y4P6_9EURY|nr:hypothetical protein MNOMIAMN_00020 [Methanosarcinales archaeon ANME-2c ERB4]